MVTPQQTLLLGLLAIVPAAVYGTLGPDLSALIAIVNVVIITVALYKAFSPAESHGNATTQAV